MSEAIRAIIIDDEEDGRLVLSALLKLYCPKVIIEGLYNSASEGLVAIEDIRPDLVFLDINMPMMNGFSMLEKLPKIDFDIIFVTAHNQHALKAIKFSALDYLLKPVDANELVLAVEKCSTKRHPQHDDRISFFIKNFKTDSKMLSQMALPVRDGFIFVDVNDIIRCEGDGNYTLVIFTNGENQLVSRTLKDFETNFQQHNFARIHKSHLINLKYVKKYIKGDGGSVIMVDNSEIEVSRRSKEAFLNMFQL